MASDRTASTPVRRRSRAEVRRLVVLHGPDREAIGRVVVLDSESLTIGRAHHAPDPLALDDSEVSRRHAVLSRDPAGEYWVDDGPAHNGTFVNGKRIGRIGLVPGDVIRAGSTMLLYQIETVRSREPLEPATQTLNGPSLAMDRVRGQIGLVAGQQIAVLVLGETGVGKELVAREIHRRSARPGPFVAVNCAALPEALVESELFGHAPGAFSGATGRSEGLFAAANDGTLLLDEIGELPVELQAKLLRALATGEVRPVGETRSIPVRARVVAATNRDLRAEVEAGRFRADLFARLAGVTIRVPPLRERREDVLPLARKFLGEARRQVALSGDAVEALLVHRWPYNVRELEQAMHTAALGLAGRETLDLEDLPEAVRAAVEHRLPAARPTRPPLALRVARHGTPSREDLEAALRHFRGSVAEVATFFGKDRRQVYRWAERHGLDPDRYREQ